MAIQNPPEFGGEQLNNSVAFEEVLGMAARYFPEMPAASTLVCKAKWSALPVVFSASERVCRVARNHSWPAFNGAETLALLEAAENDRAFLSDFQGWCELKIGDPKWRLRREKIMAGVSRPDPPKLWTVARLLRYLDLELDSIEVEGLG